MMNLHGGVGYEEDPSKPVDREASNKFDLSEAMKKGLFDLLLGGALGAQNNLIGGMNPMQNMGKLSSNFGMPQDYMGMFLGGKK